MDDPRYADYEIDEMYARTSTKIVGIIAFMEEHLYARINPNRMQIIEDYLADEETDIDDLEDLAEENKDLFLKKDIEEETKITGMKEKLEALA